MKTTELIESLAANLAPVRPGAMLRRLLHAAALGGATTLAIVTIGFGVREDLGAALAAFDFWRKLAFTLAVAIFGFLAVVEASRPDAKLRARLAWLSVPFALILGLALLELAPLAAAERRSVWLGETWIVCPWSIVVLAIPPLTAFLLAMRRLAPTRPAIAGAIAGIASGGLAAAAYGLHCPEWAASFVATWYVLGILFSGLLGALAGKRVLRW